METSTTTPTSSPLERVTSNYVSMKLKPDKTKLERFADMMEWLYLTDGTFKSKTEWREEFVIALRDALEMPSRETEEEEPRTYTIAEKP